VYTKGKTGAPAHTKEDVADTMEILKRESGRVLAENESLKDEIRRLRGGTPMSNLNEAPGSEHYHGFKIQPIEFIRANGLGFLAGNVIKYVCRYGLKDGLGDLLKARQYIDWMIEDCQVGAGERTKIEPLTVEGIAGGEIRKGDLSTMRVDHACEELAKALGAR